MNNDLVAIDVLRKKAVQTLPPEVLERVHWVDFDINTRSIRALVGKTDALVTSRFHGMVAGLALCVPTMVIGWSHKYRETLADFGMASYAINYELGLEETLTIFRDFWKNKAQIQGLLEGRVEAVRTSASTQFDYLREEIRLEIGG
jgi:polysaccharide pyruvyl transferase WcaK-like protein